MLYPRETANGLLVSEDQMVGHREHLAQSHRVLFLSGEIGRRCPTCGWLESESHNLLMALDSLSHKPIIFFITSPGGELDAALALYDTMRLVQSPIVTVGRYCASAAALLLAAGSERYLLPHAKVMLHLPSGQAGGDVHDWEIQHAEMQKYKNKLVEALCECGVRKSPEELIRDIDRDLWLEPEEAIAYGLADKVLTKDKLAEWLPCRLSE